MALRSLINRAAVVLLVTSLGILSTAGPTRAQDRANDRAQGILDAVVQRNAPYAGGYTTARYGRPRAAVHALQIEINRALYMDEDRLERGPRLAAVAADMTALIEALARLDPVAQAAE